MGKVSIIIPMYNVSRYIEKCVRTLFEQTFDDIEYLFVNDATPDDSIEILKHLIELYPNRKGQCKIVNHHSNKGLTAARNSGLNVATGDYIIYCDSDDWVELTMISDMYNAAIVQDADIVSCDFQMIYKDRNVLYHTVDWTENKVDSLRNYIRYEWTVIWNLLVKRKLYTENGIKFLEGHAYCEDFNASVKLLYFAKKVVYLRKVLYNYNQLNANSIMRNLSSKTMNDEQVMYFDVIDFFKRRSAYSDYKKQLCWRILKSKQEWALDTATYNKFLDFYPESHKYIISCPYLNVKLKIMMWSLTHRLAVVSRFMLLLRKIRHYKDAR